MTLPVIALALFAAILHASWNAFLRVGADRFWSVTVMSFSSTIAGMVMAFFAPLPSGAAWPFIVLSSVLQVGYSVFLVAAYRQGELGQIYPIVRGIVPLLVTVGGFLFAGQHLAPVEIAGVVLLAAGIMSLAFGAGHATWVSIGYALLTGLIIAAYGTVDAIGVRAGGNATSYTAWILIVYGIFLPLAYFAVRRRLDFTPRMPGFGQAFLGGLLATIAYGVIILAFTMGPAGPITALRETSVVFAALIGWLFLKEKLTARRILACVVVAAGAILIGYQG